jgi:hypothetical protein
MTEMATCKTCGSSLPRDEMYQSEDGLLCMACEADADASATMKKGMTIALFAVPGFLFLGTLLVVIANVFLFVLGPPISLALGIGGISQGIATIKLFPKAKEYKVNPLYVPFLLVGGILEVLWGVSMVGLSLLSCTAWMAAIS